MARPDWYAGITAWADNGLLGAAGLTFGAASVGYGVAVAVSPAVPRWTGWFTTAVGALLIGEFVFTGDVIPLLTYLAPLPCGVALLLRAVAASRVPHKQHIFAAARRSS